MTGNQRKALDSFLSGDCVLGEEFKIKAKEIIEDCLKVKEKIETIKAKTQMEQALMNLSDAKDSLCDTIANIALSTGITKNPEGFDIFDILSVLSDTKTTTSNKKNGSC